MGPRRPPGRDPVGSASGDSVPRRGIETASRRARFTRIQPLMGTRMERILILGMTPLVEQLLVEVGRRPACGTVVVGILDEVVPVAAVAPGVTLGPLSRLGPLV